MRETKPPSPPTPRRAYSTILAKLSGRPISIHKGFVWREKKNIYNPMPKKQKSCSFLAVKESNLGVLIQEKLSFQNSYFYTTSTTLHCLETPKLRQVKRISIQHSILSIFPSPTISDKNPLTCLAGRSHRIDQLPSGIGDWKPFNEISHLIL